jgi:hypothetical protein
MLRLQITSSKNIRTSSGESMSFLQGRLIAILDKRSTINMIPVYPDAFDYCKSVMKSMLIPSQGRDGSDRGMLSP